MWFRSIFGRKARADAPASLFDEALLRRLDRVSLLAPRRLRGRSIVGEHPSARLVPTSIFDDHRRYSPGDDIRSIDWNAYAHQNVLYVKLGEIEQDINVHLLCDRSRSMGTGQPTKHHAAQRLTAALGYLALTRHDRLRISAFDESVHSIFGPAQGKARLVEMVRSVEALASAGGRSSLGDALARLAARHRDGGLLVVLSDLLSSDDLAAGLRALPLPTWRVVVIHLLAPDELEPTALGSVELEDSEQGERLALVIDDDAAAAYRRAFARWQRQIATACAARGATYARVMSDWPIERQVVPYLRARQVLG
jgi:uncharacterized protein (DUF58 family)